MAIARKKGFRIETKTFRTKLLRDGFNLSETNALFSEVTLFFLLTIADDPSGVDESDFKRYYEPRFFSPEATHTFPFDCPQVFRRAALSKAVGIYRSWRSNYEKWKQREEKRLSSKKRKPMKKHRPPTLPSELRLNATFYSGMFKDDDGESIVLKVVNQGVWKWVKFRYQAPELPAMWQMSTPALVTKQDGSAWLNWVIERYQPATGGIHTVMQDGNKICTVDLDLDGELAKCAIYSVEVDGTICEVARMTTRGHKSHLKLRKSRLGEIAQLMKKTGAICKGFASTRWRKIRNGEIDQSRKQAKQIVEFAYCHGAAVIVFEHLRKLRPSRERFSRRSNQKRAYWLKSAVQKQASRIARQNHNILTSYVNPRDTSNIEAITGEPVMRVNKMWQAQHLAFDSENWDFFKLQEGYHPGNLAVSRSGKIINSGLNACRNIVLKFCKRYYSKPQLAIARCDESSISTVVLPT
jgi:IS605 OrfB family transposase